jgi:GNAT superfamily N-acetyltransferase
MDGVRFRPARGEDARAVLDIKRAAIGGIDDGTYTDRQLSAWQPDQSAVSEFRRAIESDTFDVLVAEIRGDPVGYGVLNTDDDRIDAVFVDPDYAGNGVASSLVRQFESRAQMRAVPELTIVSSLNAKGLYESLQYWDFGRKTRRIDGVDIEFAIMHKRFQTD